MDVGDALAWLDAHWNLEARSVGVAQGGRADRPSREAIAALVDLLADPQRAYPVIHLTGTNGKTSTARILTSLLLAMGLATGTYTSPHLERINERMTWNGRPIGDDDLAAQLSHLAALEPLVGARLSWFELVTTAAFSWFADVAVDVGVIEVGLGGRWDATNVADATVAVITNVGLDHVEYLGPDRADIAREKAGIVKPGATLVLGETDPDLLPIFEQAGAERLYMAGEDFGVIDNQVAVGGRLLDLRTPQGTYSEVFLPLHGAHQGDNAVCALSAAEAFFGEPLDPEVVVDAFAAVESPGRMEIMRREPLCIIDGAHNVAGAQAAALTLEEEFGAVEGRVVVFGVVQGHDPRDMLEALDPERIRLVVACPAPSPRTVPASEVADAARSLGLEAEETSSVGEAVSRALDLVAEDELVFITGSLYVVGAARAALR